MLLLCQELCTFAKEALKDLPLERKSGELWRTPAVYGGWLPQAKAGEVKDDTFPFVIVRPMSGRDTQDSGVVNMGLFIGTYSQDDAGWWDCMNVLNRLRCSLETLQEAALPHGYLTAGEGGKIVEWELYEEQAYPQWFARISVHFEIGRGEHLPEKEFI